MEINVDELMPMCAKCKGVGTIKREREMFPEPCGDCGSTGYKPTAAGLALVEFIQRAKQAGLLR